MTDLDWLFEEAVQLCARGRRFLQATRVCALDGSTARSCRHPLGTRWGSQHDLANRPRISSGFTARIYDAVMRKLCARRAPFMGAGVEPSRPPPAMPACRDGPTPAVCGRDGSALRSRGLGRCVAPRLRRPRWTRAALASTKCPMRAHGNKCRAMAFMTGYVPCMLGTLGEIRMFLNLPARRIVSRLR